MEGIINLQTRRYVLVARVVQYSAGSYQTSNVLRAFPINVRFTPESEHQNLACVTSNSSGSLVILLSSIVHSCAVAIDAAGEAAGAAAAVEAAVRPGAAVAGVRQKP